MWVQLDRALVTTEWLLKFPLVRLHHLQGLSSDHKPLWLASNDIQTRFYQPQRPFRFESMWLKDERCEEMVHSVWDLCSHGNPIDKVLRKVSDCQNQLKLWDKNIFSNVHIVLARKRKELLKAESASMVGKGHASVKVLTNEIK